jgi:hypothetical protein
MLCLNERIEAKLVQEVEKKNSFKNLRKVKYENSNNFRLVQRSNIPEISIKIKTLIFSG